MSQPATPVNNTASMAVYSDASVATTIPVMTAATSLLSLRLPSLPGVGAGVPPLPSVGAGVPPLSDDAAQDDIPHFPALAEDTNLVLEEGPLSLLADTPPSFPESRSRCGEEHYVPMPELDESLHCQPIIPCSRAGDNASGFTQLPDTSAHATNAVSNGLPEMSAGINKQLLLPKSYKPGPHMIFMQEIIYEYNVTKNIVRRDNFCVKLTLYDLRYIEHVLKAPEVASILRVYRRQATAVAATRKHRQATAAKVREQAQTILEKEHRLAVYASIEARSTTGTPEVDDLKRENATLKRAMEEAQHEAKRCRKQMEAAMKEKEEFRSKYKEEKNLVWRLKNPEYHKQRCSAKRPNTPKV